jgi:hypothetical protein
MPTATRTDSLYVLTEAAALSSKHLPVLVREMHPATEAGQADPFRLQEQTDGCGVTGRREDLLRGAGKEDQNHGRLSAISTDPMEWI